MECAAQRACQVPARTRAAVKIQSQRLHDAGQGQQVAERGAGGQQANIYDRQQEGV
jgi:hypothetical protein